MAEVLHSVSLIALFEGLLGQLGHYIRTESYCW